MTAVATLVLIAFVAVCWGLALGRPRAAFTMFLCAALYNYWYVIGAGWSVAWAAEGGVSEGAPTMIKYAKDMAFVGVCHGFLVVAVLRGVPSRLQVHALDIMVYALAAYGFVLTIVSLPSLGALAGVAYWQNFGYAAAYPCTRLALAWSTSAEVLRVERTLLRNMTIVALIGIVQFVLGPAPYAYVSGPYAGLNRAVSTLGNPNGFAMVMSIAVLWCVVTQRRRLRAAWLASAGVLSLSVTGVGGSLIVAAALVLRQLRVVMLLALLLFGIIGTVTAFTLAPAVGTRVTRVLAGEDESMVARLQNWRRLVPRDPLTALFGQGTGKGGSITVSFHENDGLLADNQYLALLTQFGLLGMTLFVGVVALALSPIVTTGSLGGLPTSAGLRVAAAASVMAIAIFGVSANVLNMFPINLLFWTCVGVVGGADVIRPVRGVDQDVTEGS